jgi:hypothetical protein
MYKIQIDDVIRDATPEEIVEIEADKAEFAAKEFAIKAKEEAKLAAQEKLAALGIEIDDLKALGLA